MVIVQPGGVLDRTMDHAGVPRAAVQSRCADSAGDSYIRAVSIICGTLGGGSQALPPLRLYRLSPQAAGRSTGERGSRSLFPGLPKQRW
jgi:hypothetical protein